MEWPRGKRFEINDGRIGDQLSDDAPVEIWVCCRVDEPWTWRVIPNQHIERCRDCGAEIVFAVSARSPTNPDVVKLCRACTVRLSQRDGPVQ